MSQYPTISPDDALSLYSRLPTGLSAVEREVATRLIGVAPIGSACEFSHFNGFIDSWKTLRADSINSRPYIEGALACSLFDLLDKAPKAALEDIGYWRWVAALPLREFVLWQGAKIAGTIPSKASYGINATSHAALVNAIPYRMYLRGALATEAQRLEPSLKREELAETGGNALWGTEILRRKGLGSYALSAAAFLNEAKGKPVPLYRAAVTHLERLGAQISRLDMGYQDAINLTKEAFEIANQEMSEKKVSGA